MRYHVLRILPLLLCLAAACPVQAATLAEFAERIGAEFPPPPGWSESMAEGNADPSAAHWGGRFGETLPGVTRRLPPSGIDATAPGDGPAPKTLALTLDACGGRKGHSLDEEVLALLREHGIPATIFVTSLWLRSNRENAEALAADPLFSLQAHGSRHKPASVSGREIYGIKGTESVAALVQEVEGNARDIAAITGKRPRWYRSGTAYYDEVAIAVIRRLGFRIAGYSLNADQGASLPEDEIAARLEKAADRDIIICHLNRPGQPLAAALRRAIPLLLEQGFHFVPLPE